MNTFKLILTAIMFVLAVFIIGGSMMNGCSDGTKVVGTVPYDDPRTICNVCDAIGDFERWAWDTYGVRATLTEGPAPDDAVDIQWDDATMSAAATFDWDAYCKLECWVIPSVVGPIVKCRSNCYPWPTLDAK